MNAKQINDTEETGKLIKHPERAGWTSRMAMIHHFMNLIATYGEEEVTKLMKELIQEEEHAD